MEKRAIFCLLLVLGVVHLAEGQKDDTVVPGTYGSEVVSAVSAKLRQSLLFPDDNRFLVRMAYVETKYGFDPNTYLTPGGIWKVSANLLNATKSVNTTEVTYIRNRLRQIFNIQWSNVTMVDMDKPFYSGLAIKIFLATLPVVVPDTIARQADFWKEVINPNGVVEQFIREVRELEAENVCEGKMDLVIALDGSTSVNVTNFGTAKRFVANLTSTFNLDSTRIGFIVYSTVSRTIFNLTNTLNQATMSQAILNVSYAGGTTYTNLAINSAMTLLGLNESPIPRVLTVFTDGQSTDRNATVISAAGAKARGIISFAVGIGGVDREELLIIAGNDPIHVISTSNFDSLAELPYRVNEETCTIPQRPTTNGSITDNIGNETRYFEYEIPPMGITITITITSGQVTGYFSYNFPTPNSAFHDGTISGPTFIPRPTVSQQRTFMQKANYQAGTENAVFIAIKGNEKENNQFSIDTLEGNHVPINSGNIVFPGSMLILFISYLIYFVQ